MFPIIIEIFGWTASFLILLAYALNSFHWVKSGSAIYQWLNIVGSIFMVVNTTYHNAIPSTFTNAVWAGIGVIALLNLGKKENKNS